MNMRGSLRSFSLSLIFLAGAFCHAGLQKLENLTLVEHASNDGDSFRATDGETAYYLRLYFVDCAETGADSETMARRVREQTRYFGLDEHADTIEYGKKAAEQTRAWLAKPFTAYTSYADAMGRSSQSRIYAFVITADGHNLDQLLVEKGLARTYGVGRADFEGTHRDERRAYLEDLEVAAMLERVGIWSTSNPTRIAQQRAEQRREDRELHEIRAELGFGQIQEGESISLNEASLDDLQRLPGVGPVLAARIEANRPFHSLDQLRTVSGIGTAILEKLRPYLLLEQ